MNNGYLNFNPSPNMKAEIFVGLGQPKSQLYFDLQAMIAVNGGRNKIADALEAEMVKEYLPHCPNVVIDRVKWSEFEVLHLTTNYMEKSSKQLANDLGRTWREVEAKLSRLYKKGLPKRR